MKTKQIVVAIAAVIILIGAYQYGTLDAASSAAPARIGVINVTEVLENCQKHKDWQAKMKAEQAETEKQVNKLQDEIEALQAQLKILTPGSSDFVKMQSDYLEKKALIDAKNEIYRRTVEAEMQRWFQELYQQLLVVVEQISQQQGLDVVITDEKAEIPAPSLRDFMLSIKTKNVLYHNPQYNITAAALEAMNNLK